MITARNHANRIRRARRTRAKLALHSDLPRLSVHRTLRHIYAQIIDDTKGMTVAAASDLTIENKKATKTEIAKLVGAAIAGLAKEKKVTAVRFDRGSFKYHGRVAALAEAARENGLTF
ncbi:MAG TPA: 50S ribosomal protein L18 [Verrucomicrobiae bacterium]|nr:50S ribosomal protein L18 [Verrucomicrobiae bacterium]